MSAPKADQRSATQIKAEAIVAAALAADRVRHGEVSPEPNRFLRPRMVWAPVVVSSARGRPVSPAGAPLVRSPTLGEWETGAWQG